MHWVDGDLTEEPCPARNNTFTNSCGPAALGRYKNHLYLLLCCSCLENLGVCSAHAPTKQCPAAPSTEWFLHCLTAELPLKCWHRQHATRAAQRLVMQGHAHSSGTVPLPFSPHRKGQKRREKPEINIKGRSEAMNSTYATISKDRKPSDFAECFLWLMFPLLIYSRNDAVMVSVLKPSSLKGELINLNFIALKTKK